MQVRGGHIEMNWFKSLWGGAANLGRSDNETIQQRIRRHVERRGGTPAVWFAPDQFCSYSQMNENATVISQALKSASGASSPRVCFPMPRGSSALYGFLGAIGCGTCYPLDGKLRQNEFDEAYSVLLPDVVLSSESQSIGVKAAAAAGIAVVIYEISSDHGNCRIVDVRPARNRTRGEGRSREAFNAAQPDDLFSSIEFLRVVLLFCALARAFSPSLGRQFPPCNPGRP